MRKENVLPVVIAAGIVGLGILIAKFVEKKPRREEKASASSQALFINGDPNAQGRALEAQAQAGTSQACNHAPGSSCIWG